MEQNEKVILDTGNFKMEISESNQQTESAKLDTEQFKEYIKKFNDEDQIRMFDILLNRMLDLGNSKETLISAVGYADLYRKRKERES
jgi:hypothetical protein